MIGHSAVDNHGCVHLLEKFLSSLASDWSVGLKYWPLIGQQSPGGWHSLSLSVGWEERPQSETFNTINNFDGWEPGLTLPGERIQTVSSSGGGDTAQCSQCSKQINYFVYTRTWGSCRDQGEQWAVDPNCLMDVNLLAQFLPITPPLVASVRQRQEKPQEECHG